MSSDFAKGCLAGFAISSLLYITNPDEASFKRKWEMAIARSADNPLDRGIERVAFSWKYQNYHLFSFVPVQERLSGRMLDTAYLGAAGLWIPVRPPSLNASLQLKKLMRALQVPNLQSLAHSVNAADVRIPARR